VVVEAEDVDVATDLFLIGLVAGVAWLVLRPRYLFVVRIEGGVPHIAKGMVTADFLRQVQMVCAEAGVTRAWVSGLRRGRRVRLAFSRGMPPSCRQQLRNLWPLHG
jgi:hypothetical protein